MSAWRLQGAIALFGLLGLLLLVAAFGGPQLATGIDAVGLVERGHERLVQRAVQTEAVALPAPRPSQHLAGVVDAEEVMAVVGVGGCPRPTVQRLGGPG